MSTSPACYHLLSATDVMVVHARGQERLESICLPGFFSPNWCSFLLNMCQRDMSLGYVPNACGTPTASLYHQHKLWFACPEVGDHHLYSYAYRWFAKTTGLLYFFKCILISNRNASFWEIGQIGAITVCRKLGWRKSHVPIYFSNARNVMYWIPIVLIYFSLPAFLN